MDRAVCPDRPPYSLVALFRAGIPVERLFSERELAHIDTGPARLASNALDFIFKGKPDFYGKHRKRCHAGQEIWRNRLLTDLDLLKAFVRTAYTGPVTFSEKVDFDVLKQHATDVGSRLMEAGFVDPESVTEKWDNNPGSYRARSAAAEGLRQLADQISTVSAIDASHDLFQFALWLDSSGRIRVRPFGVGSIGRSAPEFLREGQSLVFRDGILQPLGLPSEALGEDAIETLEDMINSADCSELDFQRFFSQNPIILAGLDYKQVHPQLVLFNEDGPGLIPDFLLEPLDTRFCDLLELKLPYGDLVRRLQSGSRTRFRSTVNEAVAQLTEYRRYFESAAHRKQFHTMYGLEAYYPKMILVIGRRHHFRDDIERQALKSMLPRDLDLWTYDDLLARAKRYLSCVQSMSRTSARTRASI